MKSKFLPSIKALAVVTLATTMGWGAAHAQAQKPWHDLGRAAKPAEIKAWDIDVRPDFKGLPKGAGSVSLGENCLLYTSPSPRDRG